MNNNTAVSLVFVDSDGELQVLEFPDIVLLAAHVFERRLRRNDYAIIDGSILLSPDLSRREMALGSEYSLYDDPGSQIREALPEDLTSLGDQD